MPGHNEFMFVDPGRLVDEELELVVEKYKPSIPEKGWVPAYEFGMYLADTGTRVGRISLRIGNNDHIRLYAGHIGYSVVEEFHGRRYAARSCHLLFPLASRYGLDPLWITCNPENTPSRRTCEIAGGVYIETVPVPLDNPINRDEGEPYKCRYRFDLARLLA